MDYSLTDFSLSVLSSSAYGQKNSSLYNSSYLLWRSNWLKTLKKLDGIENLYSEDFTRHDFFLVITHRQEPVALCCFRKVDLKLPAAIHDSWFNPWPKDFLIQLARDVESAIVPSWFTVHPNYRRSANFDFINLSGVLSELMSIVTIHQNADVTFSSPRKERSVDKLLADAGAVTVYTDIIYHGVKVDLVCFFLENLKKHKFSKLALDLWENRTIYNQQPKEKNENNIQV